LNYSRCGDSFSNLNEIIINSTSKLSNRLGNDKANFKR
jgi:hypothetical protein